MTTAAMNAADGWMRCCGSSSRTLAIPVRGFAPVLIAASMIGLVYTAGCSLRTNTFDIVDYRDSGMATRYRETFDEAYYDLDRQGNVDIVLRRRQPSETDPGLDVTQVIHIRGVWRSIPGDTVAGRTQINGTVSYGIVSGAVGGSFEGAGALFFRQNRRKDLLMGSLECVSLKPKRQLTGGGALFERAELSGEFRARRNPSRVVRIINDMNRVFQPLPAHP